jgi:hypothetical protein
MDQEQINVWLFTFLDGVHLLDRFDQARKKRFDSVSFTVVEGLCSQEQFRSRDRGMRRGSLSDHCRISKE